jgi:hypothetical protein
MAEDDFSEMGNTLKNSILKKGEKITPKM